MSSIPPTSTPISTSTTIHGSTAMAPGFEKTSAAGLGAVGFDATAWSSFTPEMVLYVAKQRMGSIDDQVKATMDGLEDLESQSKEIGNKIATLRKLQQNINAKTKDDGVRLDGHSTDAEKHISRGNMIEVDGREITNREFLEARGIEIGEDIQVSEGKDKAGTYEWISNEQIESVIKALSEEQTELNSSNEMTMLSLQSLMQQRTQIISLSTNLLQKMDEGAQAVIRNLV